MMMYFVIFYIVMSLIIAGSFYSCAGDGELDSTFILGIMGLSLLWPIILPFYFGIWIMEDGM
jgi:hypothetical protein